MVQANCDRTPKQTMSHATARLPTNVKEPNTMPASNKTTPLALALQKQWNAQCALAEKCERFAQFHGAFGSSRAGPRGL